MNVQLSNAQLAVLLPAVDRPDRCLYPVSAKLKGGAVGNIAASLLKRGLLEEIAADDNATVWRWGDDGTPLTLRATDLAGQFAADDQMPPSEQPDERGARSLPPTRRGAAQETLLAILMRPEGGTVAEMQAATGWLAHSVRGALSGVIRKKLGHTVLSSKEPGRGRVYRVAGH